VLAVTHLFAGIPTADFELALSWYERFLQRSPNGFPTAGEAVWHLADAGLLYLVADDERAGHALVTLIVEDLDAWTARLKRDGMAHGEIEALTGGVRKTTILDPDGNSITLGQTPGSGD
jgi:predicted enzyme related to lactoylglutathione lyase